MDLTGKVALVTGASSGIGRAIAMEFAASGAKVIVHYHRNKDAAEKTMSDLKGNGHYMFCCDLSDQNAIPVFFDEIIKKSGHIDILVNNAAVFQEIPITTMDYNTWLETWNKTIGPNLLGPANLSFIIMKNMIVNGGGRIINISSRGAFRGEPDAPAYGASKAGLNALSQSMAKALAPHNIFVYVIAPGFVNTGMVENIFQGPEAVSYINQSPLKRIAEPEEIARLALFLAAENTEYMTGCIIDMNGASYLRT